MKRNINDWAWGTLCREQDGTGKSKQKDQSMVKKCWKDKASKEVFQGRVSDELSQVMLIKWEPSTVEFTGDFVHDKWMVGVESLIGVQENGLRAFRVSDYWYHQRGFLYM